MRSSVPAFLVLLAGLCASAGCRSAPAPTVQRQPYKVVLLSVEGAERALAAAQAGLKNGGAGDAGDFVPLSLTPAEIETAVFEGVRKSNAFSELVAAPASASAAAPEFGEESSPAADFARSVNADLLLRITVKSAQLRDAGNNGSTFWSTFLWFLVPLPTWFADDRTYETNIAIEAALYEPRDMLKPTASVVATSGKHDLDLWDRGLSVYVPIIPPPFLKGNMETVSREVTERAMAQVMSALVTELQTREIPSRFEMSLVPEGGTLRLSVVSRRQLRSIDVWVGGKLSESWHETALAPDAASTRDLFTYTRTATIPAKPAAPVEVRVSAQDEAGAREVRTIVLGRSE